MLLALAAAVAPIARWCPLRWEQVDRDAFLECAVLPISTMASCSTFQALVHEAAHEGRATCPAAGACEAMNECPVRAGVPMPASHPVHSERGRGRAYCLDEPFMSSATRASTPSLDHAVMQAAIVTAIAALSAPRAVEYVAPAPEARPPTADLEAQPPIRGPPALLG
jgi:hypothetical protein